MVASWPRVAWANSSAQSAERTGHRAVCVVRVGKRSPALRSTQRGATRRERNRLDPVDARCAFMYDLHCAQPFLLRVPVALAISLRARVRGPCHDALRPSRS